MKKFSIYLRLVLFFGAIGGFNESLIAQNQVVRYIQVLNGALGQLAVDSNRIVMDSAFFDPIVKPSIVRTNKVTNIINFQINENAATVLPDSFKVDLNLRIYYINKDSLLDSIATKTLSINYYKNKSYNNKAVFFFEGAYWVKMKVLSITATYTALANLQPVLQLENRMTIDRQFQMDCTNNAVQAVNQDISTVSTKGELSVYWTPVMPAEEYDLEWTYIDTIAINSQYYYLPGTTTLDPNRIFRNNASQVSLNGSSYRIPLIYNGDGILFYRVRSAQYAANGERKVSAWSSSFAGGLGQYAYAGHERSLNWQSSTSFAEEGKHKTVVQYFDGTLRNRQTVTKDNSTDTIIVAETLYDKQGRPMIQVMPSPTLSSLIGYTPLFNQTINSAEYDKSAYDTLIGLSEYCDSAAPAMSNLYGASQYYSPNNPLKVKGFNKYIPDANDFPFTETRYTQDNTGRIARQSGVDSFYRIGKGHETRYYYGTADQADLDALFGTEVGDASHYQKNMVRDANGQYSVSYVDMHGRTIATALAGASPSSLQALSSNNNSTQTDSLINKSNNIIKGSVIESVKSLLVPKSGPYQFKYALNPASLGIADCNSQNICYDCLYDLTITITCECGGTPIIIQRSNFSLGHYDTTCNSAGNFAIDTTCTLEEGSYLVTKSLFLHEDAMNWYRDSLFAIHNFCQTESSILQAQTQLIKTQLGDCQQPESGWHDYQDYREQALFDLTPPFGQYAKYPPETLPALSIFDKIGSLFKYQIPSPKYLDENGKLDSVYNSLGQLVPPDQLDTVDFVKNFKASWANSLLLYHPEYCLLDENESLQSSHIWNEGMQRTETYQAAKAAGYLNPTSNPFKKPAKNFSSGNDPLFSVAPAARQSIEDSLFKYRIVSGYTYTLWNIATMNGHCNSATCENYYKDTSNAFREDSLGAGELDMAWRLFRNEYLRLKAQWIDGYIRTQCGNPVVPTGAVPVFPKANDLINGNALTNPTGNYMQATKDSAAAYYDGNCRANAFFWWQRLAPCNFTSADSAIIIPRLINVCKQGSDSSHPFGASTIKPGSNYAYTSFDDVIKKYTDSLKLVGRNIDRNNCNGFLIDGPKPYNQPYALINQNIYSKPDSCQCAKLDTLYSQYLASNPEGNFQSYIHQTQSTDISQGTLDSLRNYCHDSIRVKFLANPLVIPPALQCGVENVCRDCNDVKLLYDTFKVRFPGVMLDYDENDSTQRIRNQLFANWMNSQLGYSKSAVEYLTFMDTCGISKNPGVSSLSCDTLASIKNDFLNFYYNKNIKYDSTGSDTTTWKVDTTGSTNNTGVLHNQIFKNGIAQFPNVLSKEIDFDHYFNKDTMCNMNNKFIFEARIKRIVDTMTLDNPPRTGILLATNTGFHNIRMYIQPNTYNSYCLFASAYHIDTCEFNLNLLADSFSTWTVIKIVADSNKFKIYFDDVFKVSVDNYGPITSLNGFSIIFYPGYVGMIDWVRIWDADGKMTYDEEFDDPKHFAQLGGDPAHTCGKQECSSAFQQFFNQQRGTNYTFNQIDSIYYNQCGSHPEVCVDTNNVSCDKLQQYLTDFRNQQVKPLSGYVDLDMRTFAGNKTPDEGPKGVFNVNGQLIGNTVDSSIDQIKQSYVQIWNSSTDNQAVGTLSLLGNGKFRLTLNPDQKVPAAGIVGMRYYQFETHTKDTMSSIGTSIGSYIAFGDGTHVLTDQNYADAKTTVTRSDLNGGFYNAREIIGNDFPPYSTFGVTHYYTHSANDSTYTVTVYHTDIKGVVEFLDSYPNPKSMFSGLQGYLPQQLFHMRFIDTKDSTINTTKSIKNFYQINSLLYVALGGNHNIAPYLWNNFESFENNHNLRILRLNPGYYDLPDSISANSKGGKLFSEIFPNLPVNFPDLRNLFWGTWGTRGYDFANFNFSLPRLKYIQISWQDTAYPNHLLDTIYNQLARSNHEDSGRVVYGYPNPPSFAGSPARDTLLQRNWFLNDGISSDWGPGIVYDIISYDQLPLTNSFTDYINNALHQSLNYDQIKQLYQSKCGYFPDPYTIPPTTGLTICGKTDPTSPTLVYDSLLNNPCRDSTKLATGTTFEIYKAYKDSLNNNFNDLYTSKCLAAASLEHFTVTHASNEYHYTLYYYDQAGNLVKTIPPAGVNLSRDSAWLAQVAQKRDSGLTLTPSHTMATVYRYNSLNQVVSQKTPDASGSSFWYDRLGRLAVSQNKKQQIVNQYSYTIYDAIGRIIEVGQKPMIQPMTNTISRNQQLLWNWINYDTVTGKYDGQFVTQTFYDRLSVDTVACTPSLRFRQKPWTIRNRVSYTRFFETPTYNQNTVNGITFWYISPSGYTTGIDYSYDIHGNVDTMRNLFNAAYYSFMANHGYNKCKTIVYKYDLISGKVNEVHYNPGQNDEFYHRYSYDAENRITDVYVTNDRHFIKETNLEEHQAHYDYYRHGPLARMVLGQQQVQGLDYAYTLQGWLKGVNSTSLVSDFDMGLDGRKDSANQWVARDVFSYALNYYKNEFKPINANVNPFPDSIPAAAYRPLYNGNIRSMAVNISKFNQPQMYNYQYDQLNRLVGMDVYRGLNQAANSWSSFAGVSAYKEAITYDANGNIQKYLRQGKDSPLNMDSLTYNYTPGTNKLDYVRDRINGSASHGSNYSEDIDNQSGGNYAYDSIGNLVYDRAEKLDSIKWNEYGKIVEIYKRSTTNTPSIYVHYYYDPSGNRIEKAVEKYPGPHQYDTYVRDAQGNVLAVYEVNAYGASYGPAYLIEQHMYGSSRLGLIKRSLNVDSLKISPVNANLIGATYLTNFTRGNELFELTNHLGNVLVTVSDKKYGKDIDANGQYDFYTADSISSVDYTPFGMEMVNRYSNSGSFRYGFNGKEKDNEDYGEGNGYDYGARLYNSRLGRFLSVDPLVRDYPWYTPYQFAGNKPIVAADLDGREEWMKNQEFLLKRRAQIQLEVSHQHDVFVNAPPKTFTQSWRDSKNIFDRAIYEIANGIYTLPQQLTASMRGADYIHNIGGNVHKAHGLEGEKQRTDNFVNGATVFIPGVAAEGKAEWMISKYAESTLAKIENQAVQQIAKSGLSELETRIVNEANSLLNSKEFQMVENAYKTGKEASVKIGNRTINYSPETSASSITMHPSPFFEGSGFQLGPEAFSSTEELKKTFIQELYRLNTQGTGMIDVDLVRPYTDAASAAAEKLQNFVIKK